MYKHYFSPVAENQDRTAIILVNLGTPDSTGTADVRNYLDQFLSDPRVVEMPPLLWKLILHGVILRFRPAKAARAYKKIWTEQGSPLLFYTRSLAKKLNNIVEPQYQVFTAMTYGKPEIHQVLKEIARQGFDRIKVIPLFPQYSATTSAAIYDAFAREFLHWRRVPQFCFINQYYRHPAYITAIANTIKDYLQKNRADLLLFSFHGIPLRYIQAGDPYLEQCQQSVRLIADKAGLDDKQWQLVFQSRMGREPWLSPYADQTIAQLGKQGIKKLAVISPGFAVDCLETLEEMAMANKQLFLQNGGENFDYIPCLNDADEHAQMLKTIFSL